MPAGKHNNDSSSNSIQPIRSPGNGHIPDKRVLSGKPRQSTAKFKPSAISSPLRYPRHDCHPSTPTAIPQPCHTHLRLDGANLTGDGAEDHCPLGP